jgi:exopolyphosphatase/pppGpp-phosphohydrolase
MTHVRAALDIGSGATKMTLARVSADGGATTILHSSQVELLLRHDLQTVRAATGEARLSDAAIAELTATLCEYAKIAREAARAADLPLRMRGVATAVFRSATNGEAALDAAASTATIECRIIDQTMEGRLGYATAVAVAPTWLCDIISWDSGGGSFQISDAIGHVWEGPLGSSSMLQLMAERAQGREIAGGDLTSNPATLVECETCARFAREAIGAPPDWLRGVARREQPLVAIGGATCAFRMAQLACAGVEAGVEALGSAEVWRAIARLTGQSDHALAGAGFPQAFMLLPKLILVAVVLEALSEHGDVAGVADDDESRCGESNIRFVYCSTNGSTNGMLAEAALWD